MIKHTKGELIESPNNKISNSISYGVEFFHILNHHIKWRNYMKTKRLTLKNVEISDAQLIANWKNDPYTQEMSTGSQQYTIESEQEDIDNNQDPYYLMIITESNTPIGYIRITWMDQLKSCAWLRFGLGTHRGEGYTKEALEALIPKLFEQGVHRIEAEVYAYNTSSYKLLKALNFEVEGVRRQAHYHNGTYHDVYLFGLIENTPSTNLNDYLTFVSPYYKQTDILNAILSNLNQFDLSKLNIPKLHFLACFHGLLKKLQKDTQFMGQTLSKLSHLNWTSDQIKDALFSLERQLYHPISEEEKIIHDLYVIEQIGVSGIARALTLEEVDHQLYKQIINKIKENQLQFFTSIGKDLGEEKLQFTKQILQQ